MVKLSPFLIQKKLPGSTVFEVVISMVIIVFVIGIALMILSNVTRLSLSAKELRANATLQQEMLRIKAANDTTGGTTFFNDWKMEKTVKSYAAGDSLKEVDLTMFDANGIKIATTKSIILYGLK